MHHLSGSQAAQLLSPWACTRVSPVFGLTGVLTDLTCWLVQGTMGFRWEMGEWGLLSTKVKKWEGASCFPSPASLAQKALLSWVQSGGSCLAWLGRATDSFHLLAGLCWRCLVLELLASVSQWVLYLWALAQCEAASDSLCLGVSPHVVWQSWYAWWWGLSCNSVLVVSLKHWHLQHALLPGVQLKPTKKQQKRADVLLINI